MAAADANAQRLCTVATVQAAFGFPLAFIGFLLLLGSFGAIMISQSGSSCVVPGMFVLICSFFQFLTTICQKC